MPGGFPFSGATAGGGGGGVGGGGGSSSRQQATYVWDLLPYSRRGVGFAAGSSNQQQQQQQQLGSDPAGDAGVVSAAASASEQQPMPPRQLSESEASLLEQLYRRKVRESREKYELVATFRLRYGRVHAYHVYRTRVPFQLTERRKKLLRDYYSQGCQDVALYVNQAEFEHYMPLSGLSFKKHRGGGEAASPADRRSTAVAQTRSVNGLKSFLGIS